MRTIIARASVLWLAVATLTAWGQIPRPLPGRGPMNVEPPKASFETYAGAQWVVVGKVTAVKMGPVSRSLPPIYSLTLTLEVRESLRGSLDGEIECVYSTRQSRAPEFPEGSRVVVAGATKGDRLTAEHVAPLTDDGLELARSASRLPMGWGLLNGEKPVSPWSDVPNYTWPKSLSPDGVTVCAVTGRPALMAGETIEMRAEMVEPKEKVKYQNTYGDGEFTITVTNTGDTAVTVPALLANGDSILWADSLAVVAQDTRFVFPDRGKVTPETRPVSLEPGESVSTTVNCLTLQGIKWPRGGMRVYFKFCLGEQSADAFMYYFSKRHDPMRQAANAQ